MLQVRPEAASNVTGKARSARYTTLWIWDGSFHVSVLILIHDASADPMNRAHGRRTDYLLHQDLARLHDKREIEAFH